jgi:hypothetical protein
VEFAQVFSRQLLSDFENGVIGLRRFPGTSRLPCYSGGVRSLSELRFRLSRELSNFRILRAPPRLPSRRYDMAARLPVPASFAHRLRDSAFERDTLHLAAEILAHRLPLFGGIVDTGPSIDWRRDYIHQRTSGLEYFRRVPYLDFDSVGDHKLVWELNRHQHLVLLAQAACLTGRQEFLEEAFRQLRTWLAANPFLRGVNWTSALEVAFRALSWLWLYHLAADSIPGDLRHPWLESLYRHALYLRHNLSVYFSPNTHLLGEAVALHAVATLFPEFPDADEFAGVGHRLVLEQMERQVREDGSHFEQSSYYHVYALDFFLFHRLLAPVPSSYDGKLALMAGYLAALMGPSRRLPLIGDDDGGRLFHPYGPRDAFGRSTLATCAGLLDAPSRFGVEADLHDQALWWLGDSTPPRAASPAPQSRLFPRSGTAVLFGRDVHVVADAGPFGSGSAGHSHSDTLSFVARRGDQDLLVDAGSFVYVGDPASRDWFRGSAAHNTVRIDRLHQALPAGPFRWLQLPGVEILAWSSGPGEDFLDAACRYRGFTHRRRLLFRKRDLILFVLDDLSGPPGEHDVEQFWHLGGQAQDLGPRCVRLGVRSVLALGGAGEISLTEGAEHGWRSRVFGEKTPAWVARCFLRAPLPLTLAAALVFDSEPAPHQLSLVPGADGVALSLRGPRPASALFPALAR